MVIVNFLCVCKLYIIRNSSVCCIYSMYVLYMVFVFMCFVFVFSLSKYIYMYVCCIYVLLQCGRTAFAEHWSLK